MQQAASPTRQPPDRLHQRDAKRNLPLFRVLERNSHKGYGVAVHGLEKQEVCKAELWLAQKELRPTAGSWRKTSIARQHAAPKPKATTVIKANSLSAAWKKMAQVVDEHKLLGGWCDPQGGISSGASQMEAEGVLGQKERILLFHCWFSIPSLAKRLGFQAIYIQRQLEKSFDKLHPEMLADTQDRLCYSKIMFTVKWFRDWGIIQHGPTAQHLQKYQIPNDSWQQESISRSRDSFSSFFFFPLE